MGTRLRDPATGTRVWDPFGRLPQRAPAAVSARLLDHRPLAPDLRLENLPVLLGRPTSAEAARAATIPGFGALVFDYYARLAFDLSDPVWAALVRAGTGRRPRVYVAPYDWRQSSRVSARSLALVVDRALAETGADRVVLVAHSLGGLVSRWYCKFGGGPGTAPGPGSSRVCALVLLGSPTHGTPVAYRQLKHGLSGRRPGDRTLLALFYDLLRDGGMSMIRSFQSVYELLPTQYHCARRPGWLSFDAARAGFPDASQPVRLYANRYTGFLDRPDPAMLGRLAARAAFDGALGTWVPSPTYALFSDSLRDTEERYRIVVHTGGQDVVVGEGPGDRTVVALSGAADGCWLGTGFRRPVGAVEHAAMPVNPVVISLVRSLVLDCARAPQSLLALR